MCRNKKLLGVLGMMSAMLVLSSCSLKDSLFSDTGAQIGTQRDKTDYLDTSVLEQDEEEKQTYQTAVLGKGEFVVSTMEATYNRDFYTTIPIRAKVETGTMTYVSTLVSNYQQVTVGTEIAKVETKVDPVDIQEKQIKLTRLKERYERAKSEHATQRNTDVAKMNEITDEYEKRAASILIERSDLEWEKNCRDYEMQIQDLSEELTELKNASATTTIVADRAGNIILPRKPYKAGDTIEDGDVICGIVELEDLYFVADNEKLNYRYGMDFTWSIPQNAALGELKGSMIAGTSADLFGNLDTGKAYFAIDFPEGGDTRRVANGKISGTLKTMNNVLLVPAKAVTKEDSKTYVTVVKEDGTFLKTGFIAGGSNSEYYWVLSGLDEGMTVLVKQ